MLSKKIIAWGMGISVLTVAGQLKAVDETRVLSRYKLVGVISDDVKGGTAKGIVVLKDVLTQKTLTLRSGDRLPDDSEVRIDRVQRNEVVLKDHEGQVSLTYGGSNEEAPIKTVAKGGANGEKKGDIGSPGAKGELMSPEDLETFLSDLVPYRESNGEEESLDAETVGEGTDSDKGDPAGKLFAPGRESGLREKGEVIWPPSQRAKVKDAPACSDDDCPPIENDSLVPKDKGEFHDDETNAPVKAMPVMTEKAKAPEKSVTPSQHPMNATESRAVAPVTVGPTVAQQPSDVYEVTLY